MICKCGGMTRNHETKAAYVHTCNGCGRRYERKKVADVILLPEHLRFEPITMPSNRRVK